MVLSRLWRRTHWWMALAMLSGCFLSAAQNSRDSLLQALSDSPPKSIERAEILYGLSQSYRESAPEEAIRYGEELIGLSESIGSREYLFWGNMSVGVGHAIKGEFLDLALSSFIKALEIANQYNSTDWKLKQIKARINITGVYWQQKDVEQALPYVYSNIRELEELGEQLTLADSYQSLALVHQVQQQYDSSFLYLQKAIDIYEAAGEIKKRNNALLTSGNNYREAGEFRKSLATLQRALRLASISKDTVLIIDIYPNIARTYHRLSQLGQARFFAWKGLELAEQKGQLPERATAHLVMHEIYDATRQYDSALFYFKAYSGLKERMLNEEKVKKIQELAISHQAQQKAREYALLRQQYASINLQKTGLLALSILLLAMIALAVFLIRRLRRRKAELEVLNGEVLSINARLVALMNEKKHMISLIAHDIRNPLSLIQLNTHALALNQPSDDEGRRQILSEIESATESIDAASLKIMEIENKSIEKGAIRMETIDLTQVVKASAREFQAYARSKLIDLQVGVPEKKLYAPGDPILMRHIIDNLISNAIKFSPSGRKVEVSIEREQDILAIRVRDEGPGLSAEDQARIFQKGQTLSARPTRGEHSRGEGLYLAQLFAQSMGGLISLESQPGRGALFTARFPPAGKKRAGQSV